MEEALQDHAPDVPQKQPSKLSKAINLINSDGMDMFFGGLIVLNSIILGVDLEVSLRSGGDSGQALFWIQFGFIVLFVIELLWRVLAAGPRFFCTLWGGFDTVIISTSLIEYGSTFAFGVENSPLGAVSVMRVFRLLRIVRLVRMLRIFPELQMLISGLASSLKAVFWVFMFLIILMYICALFCALELGREDDEELKFYFGSVGNSFYTHFMVLTLEGYPAIVKAAAAKSWFWYLYFVAFILFSSVVLMNVVTGILCENVIHSARNEEMENHMYQAESKKFQEVLIDFLTAEGFDFDHEITFREFRSIIQNPGVREALNTLEICLEIEDETLFQILDEDSNGSLSFSEFCQSLLRLRGSKDTVHSLLVQGDLIAGGRLVLQQLHETEEDLVRGSRMLCDTLRRRFAERVAEVRKAHEVSDCAPGGRDQRHRDHGHGGKRSKDKRSRDERGHSGAASSSAPPPSVGDSQGSGPVRRLRPELLHLAPPPAEATEDAEASAAPHASREREEEATAGERWVDKLDLPPSKQGSRPSRTCSDMSRQDGSRAADDANDEASAREAAAPRRVLALIKLAESSGTEARATLSRLRADLAASLNRVRELEETMTRPEEEVEAAWEPEGQEVVEASVVATEETFGLLQEEVAAGEATSTAEGSDADTGDGSPVATPAPATEEESIQPAEDAAATVASEQPPSLPVSPAGEAAGSPGRHNSRMELRRRLQARLVEAAATSDRRRLPPSAAALQRPNAVADLRRRRLLGATSATPPEQRDRARAALLGGSSSGGEEETER